MFAKIWSDPEVSRHVGGKPRPAHESWLRMLATEGHWRWMGYGYWAVEHEGALIGNAGFGEFRRPVVPALDAPEAGWALAAHTWGRGLASELVGALVSYADARGWPRTVAIIDPANAASARVAEKAGYVCMRTATLDESSIRIFERERVPAS